MEKEREQESLKKEPIRVKLGEEFSPFGNMGNLDDLNEGETPDVPYVSDYFSIEGLGQGRVILLELTEMGSLSYNGGKLLDLSNDNPQIIELKEQLCRIGVDIDRFEESIKKQPDIVCTVKVQRLELNSENDFLDADIINGAFFSSFHSEEHPVPNDLVIGVSAQNLKQLIFRFDQNSNPY